MIRMSNQSTINTRFTFDKVFPGSTHSIAPSFSRQFQFSSTDEMVPNIQVLEAKKKKVQSRSTRVCHVNGNSKHVIGNSKGWHLQDFLFTCPLFFSKEKKYLVSSENHVFSKNLFCVLRVSFPFFFPLHVFASERKKCGKMSRNVPSRSDERCHVT